MFVHSFSYPLFLGEDRVGSSSRHSRNFSRFLVINYQTVLLASHHKTGSS